MTIRKKYLLAVFSILFIAGCDQLQGPPPAGTVAVVDLDRIASAVGEDDAIATEVEAYAGDEQTRLNQMRDDLRAQLTAEIEKLNDQSTDEERATVNQQRIQADNRLRQEINTVQQATDQLRTDLVMKFRAEVEPVARRVATDKGMDIVVIRQPMFLHIEPAADITDAVIDAMQAPAASSPTTE